MSFVQSFSDKKKNCSLLELICLNTFWSAVSILLFCCRNILQSAVPILLISWPNTFWSLDRYFLISSLKTFWLVVYNFWFGDSILLGHQTLFVLICTLNTFPLVVSILFDQHCQYFSNSCFNTFWSADVVLFDQQTRYFLISSLNTFWSVVNNFGFVYSILLDHHTPFVLICTLNTFRSIVLILFDQQSQYLLYNKGLFNNNTFYIHQT